VLQMLANIRIPAMIAAGAWLALGNPGSRAQSPQTVQPTAPTDVWHRDTLTGDWGGLRPDLADKGVVFTLPYTGEVLANLRGGIQRGAEYDGMFQPQVDVDLDKLAGWQGGSLRVSMLELHGPQLSQGWIGNQLNVSGFAAPPATRLYNLWLQQNLFGDAVSIRAGVMTVDAEFIISQTSPTFMNTAFGWPGWAGVDLPAGGPASSLPAPGARLLLQLNDAVSVRTAVFSGDPTGHDGSNGSSASPEGTVISFRGGALVIGEVAYAINQGENAAGTPMSFKLGGWYHTGNRFQ